MGNPKTPSPWLFVLTGLPYGVVGSFVTVVMGYLTRRAGMDVGSIGWYGTLLFVPTMLQFLYAPIVDIGPKRKHWLVIVSFLGAACVVVACVMPLPDHKNAFLAFAFAAQLISGLVGSANGGILAVTMPDGKRGRAGAAWNIGNVSGGALSAWIAIQMTSAEYEPLMIGLVLAGMMVIPSLAILTVDEPPRERIPPSEVFAQTWRDVRAVLFSRQGLTGILLCASPVGTAALANYFAAIAIDYRASDDLIAFVSGPASVGLTAIGALVGGFLCDRYNRRVMYLLSGALTAVCGVVMMLSPRAPDTYLYGAMTYALITGFCFSAFTSTVLETIGKGGKAASTQYSLFTAAGNVAIAYVGLVDTRFHERHGVEGVVGSDAALNLIGVVILAIVFWRMGAFGRWRHVDEPARPGETS
jgi:MFS transporter, PAT family, beta-lactamase induction signal transducer AmpG